MGLLPAGSTWRTQQMAGNQNFLGWKLGVCQRPAHHWMTLSRSETEPRQTSPLWATTTLKAIRFLFFPITEHLPRMSSDYCVPGLASFMLETWSVARQWLDGRILCRTMCRALRGRCNQELPTNRQKARALALPFSSQKMNHARLGMVLNAPS